MQNQVGTEISFQVRFRCGITQEPDTGIRLNGTKMSQTALTLPMFKHSTAWLVCEHRIIIVISLDHVCSWDRTEPQEHSCDRVGGSH